MFEKHKKLIFAQIAGIAAVVAFVMAFIRYRQTGVFQEPTLGYFMLFGVMLVAAEIKCLRDWLRQRKALKPVEQ
jgi:hypothetical protein